MTASVFLDSGIFIAFMSRRDRWHSAARVLFGEPRPRWATSLLVVSETYSWFLHRAGEEPARNFLQLVRSLAGLRMFEITRNLHQDVCRMLERYRGCKLTYVDASSLVLLEENKIRRAWSTDHHLALTGAEVLPR